MTKDKRQPPPRCENFAALKQLEGRDVYVSEWMTVDQARIDCFALATGDRQWIHVDFERAARSSPFGTTIAHGFLSLALLGKFYEDCLSDLLPFCDVGVNYGLNKVRFTYPVREGSLVAGRLTLQHAEEIDSGVRMTFGYTLEIDGAAKPACVAESIVMRQRAGPVADKDAAKER